MNLHYNEMGVPVLSKAAIDDDAWKFLSECDTEFPLSLPLQVEELIEKHLCPRENITLGFEELGCARGEKILGKTIFSERTILIDESLADDPAEAVRLRFTLMHEYGHWRYHYDLYRKGILASNSSSRVTLARTVRDNFVPQKRILETKEDWLEWQANYFAGATLMPKALFLQQFEMERNAYGVYDNVTLLRDRADYLKRIVGYIARYFGVSKEAVLVRLHKLGQLDESAAVQTPPWAKSDGPVAIGQVIAKLMEDIIRRHRV